MGVLILIREINSRLNGDMQNPFRGLANLVRACLGLSNESAMRLASIVGYCPRSYDGRAVCFAVVNGKFT